MYGVADMRFMPPDPHANATDGAMQKLGRLGSETMLIRYVTRYFIIDLQLWNKRLTTFIPSALTTPQSTALAQRIALATASAAPVWRIIASTAICLLA